MLSVDVVAEFLPCLLLLFYILSPHQWLIVTNSSLGRFGLLCIVILYAHMDRVVGAFAATLYILYYQSDFVENFNKNNTSAPPLL